MRLIIKGLSYLLAKSWGWEGGNMKKLLMTITEETQEQVEDIRWEGDGPCREKRLKNFPVSWIILMISYIHGSYIT